MRWLLLPIFLLVGAFCAFGMLATFEPGTNMIMWRIMYALGGMLCMIGVVWVVVPRRRP